MRGGWPLIVSAQYRRSWELLYLLTARDLKLRYQDTVLGFVWSVLKPLLLGLVLYVVLKHVIRVHTNAPYQLVLLTALFPWTWFQTSTMMAAPAIANNGNLIKKVHFPRYVLPFATVTNNLVHFLLTLPIITIFILASGRHPSWSWLVGIPILTALELALLLGVGTAAGTLLGVLCSRIYIPFFQISASDAGRVLPFAVVIAWPEMLRIYAIFILLFISALVALILLLRRMRVFEAVKLGETE